MGLQGSIAGQTWSGIMITPLYAVAESVEGYEDSAYGSRNIRWGAS